LHNNKGNETLIDKDMLQGDTKSVPNQFPCRARFTKDLKIILR